MEITNISSEDLSSYSFIHDSPSTSDDDENYHVKDTIRQRRSHLSNANSQEPLRRKSVKKIRAASEPVLKHAKSSLNSREKSKLSAKPNTKDVGKKDPTISTQKGRLANRPSVRVGSSSKNSAVLRNISSSKKREPPFFTSTNKVDKPRNVPLSRGTETIGGSYKKKANAVVEIEVFMPIIDVENNTITYPECSNPIVKVYSEENVIKPREDKRRNGYLNKKNKGAVNYFTYSKPKREINSNKNVPNSLRKKDVRSTAKTSLGRNVSSVKDGNYTAVMDADNHKNTYESRSSIRKAKPNTTKVINYHKSHTEAVSVDETDPEKQEMSVEFQNLLRDITFDTENVPTSNRGEIEELFTNFPPLVVDENPKQFSRKNSPDEVNDICVSEFQRSLPKVCRIPSALSCDSVEEEDVDLCPSATIVDDQLSQSDNESEKYGKKCRSRQRWKLNAIYHQKDRKVRNYWKYKQLCADRMSLERQKSTFSSPGSLMKIDSNENGWRRAIPKTPVSSECFPTKSKWCRNIEDDGLTMDCWIERCKYLQMKQQYFQTSSETNNWRPIQNKWNF